jgi:transcriptional/translational regulatory protein YebC/TACO1
MTGHNKWSKIKRLKVALDAKRWKLFSTPVNEIAFGNNNDVSNVNPNLIFPAGLPQGMSGGN